MTSISNENLLKCIFNHLRIQEWINQRTNLTNYLLLTVLLKIDIESLMNFEDFKKRSADPRLFSSRVKQVLESGSIYAITAFRTYDGRAYIAYSVSETEGIYLYHITTGVNTFIETPEANKIGNIKYCSGLHGGYIVFQTSENSSIVSLQTRSCTLTLPGSALVIRDRLVNYIVILEDDIVKVLNMKGEFLRQVCSLEGSVNTYWRCRFSNNLYLTPYNSLGKFQIIDFHTGKLVREVVLGDFLSFFCFNNSDRLYLYIITHEGLKIWDVFADTFRVVEILDNKRVGTLIEWNERYIVTSRLLSRGYCVIDLQTKETTNIIFQQLRHIMPFDHPQLGEGFIVLTYAREVYFMANECNKA
jgi:hypothetical protein